MRIILSYLSIFLFLGFSVTCASRQTKAIEQASPGPAQNSEISSSPAPALPSTPQTAAWKGGSKNFSIEWTSQNILVKSIATNTEVVSAQKLAASRLRTAYRSHFSKSGAPNFEEFYFRYKLLALAGSIMFLKESTSYSPQSYTVETYLAIDLNAPQKAISLKDFYSPQEILAALLGNEEVKRDIQNREDAPKEAPKTLNDFFTLFHTKIIETTEVSDRIFDKLWFPANIFDSFAFVRIEQDKVVADLGVPCRADFRANEIYPLKLTLPVSAAVKTALAGETSVIKPENQNQETLITFTAKKLPR